jgi:hypothetical protein
VTPLVFASLVLALRVFCFACFLLRLFIASLALAPLVFLHRFFFAPLVIEGSFASDCFVWGAFGL